MSTTRTVYATCERCLDNEPINQDVPYPHGHPPGWTEGVFDSAENRVYTWCCDACCTKVLGPQLCLTPDGKVVSSITAIDYVCPFCLNHATAPFCNRCNGIVHFAYFPLSRSEREALEKRDGLQKAENATLAELQRRGIVDGTGQVTPLGTSLQVLLQASQGQGSRS